jgi:hypothetical protein
VEEYQQPACSRDEFDRLLQLFSDSPQDALRSGTPIALIRLGTWYALWPFFYHVMHPDLTLLTLLMRKQSSAWHNTIGATAGQIAQYIRSQLTPQPNVLTAAIRVKKHVGDIDLALYDRNTGHLLLCEVKTVFDRFRTRYQLSNYAEQRVNFTRANQQLRASKQAIENGDWSLRDIFQQSLNERPARISLLILTWWDLYNLNLEGADGDILVCNFRIFQYLFSESPGDVAALVTAIDDLSRIYCPGAWTDDFFEVDGRRVVFRTLKQTDILPPNEHLQPMLTSDLSRKVTADLPRFPADWRQQVAAQGEDPKIYDFWGADQP